MSDIFTELIVTRRPKASDTIKKAILIILTVASAAAGLLLALPFFIAFIVLLIVDYFLFPRFNVEYEYSYVNGNLDIAAVYSKQSRKELKSIDLTEADCVAPMSSHHLDGFKQTYKIRDYSAQDPDQEPYAVVVPKSREIVLLQLNGEMVKDLKYRMPMKVYDE